MEDALCVTEFVIFWQALIALIKKSGKTIDKIQKLNVRRHGNSKLSRTLILRDNSWVTPFLTRYTNCSVIVY